MNSELTYFRIHRDSDDQIPLVDEDADCPLYLYRKELVENPDLLLFKFAEPIPRKPKMADYHSSPHSVISKRVYDVIDPMQIKGIQLLPAQIRGKNDELYYDYWAIHVINYIRCIDEKLSDCTIGKISLRKVKKIVLDSTVLNKIPLRNRLIFRLEEDVAYVLFHSSIVDAILKVNPTGVKFTDITKWNNKSFFED